MNREFKPTSKLIRSLFLAAAVLATVLSAGSIEGLARHYNADAQMAGTQPVVVAER